MSLRKENYVDSDLLSEMLHIEAFRERQARDRVSKMFVAAKRKRLECGRVNSQRAERESTQWRQKIQMDAETTRNAERR